MQDNLRINDRIRIPQVRLVNSNGEQVGIVPTNEALGMARAVGMDLVEVSPNSKPPVCRIMDFGKFKYRQKKRTHRSAATHAGELKELRLRPKIDEHDLMVKVKKAQQFVSKKRRVLVSMFFRGRERQHTDLGMELMHKFVELVGDSAKVEQSPRREGNRLCLTLAPK